MYIQIMIIDSDLPAAKQLKYYLQNETVRAYYTTSVEEGIKHLAHFCYQIVVMDVSSWETDGLKQLKRIQALVSVPILVLSTNNTSDHIVEILTVADDFLQKPVDLSVCAAKIHALLRRSRKQEPPYNVRLSFPATISC